MKFLKLLVMSFTLMFGLWGMSSVVSADTVETIKGTDISNINVAKHTITYNDKTVKYQLSDVKEQALLDAEGKMVTSYDLTISEHHKIVDAKINHWAGVITIIEIVAAVAMFGITILICLTMLEW